MKQLLVLILVLCNPFVNSVWASAHVGESGEHGPEAAHIHLDDHHHSDITHSDPDSVDEHDHSTGDGAHVHICFHMLSLQPLYIAGVPNSTKTIPGGKKFYLSRSISPPVPPPNA